MKIGEGLVAMPLLDGEGIWVHPSMCSVYTFKDQVMLVVNGRDFRLGLSLEDAVKRLDG